MQTTHHHHHHHQLLLLAFGLAAPVLASAQTVEPTWQQNYFDGLDRIPTDLAVDDGGNVFVGGYTSSGSPDYLVLKYSPDGTRLWDRAFDESPENPGDRITDVATDSQGNVIVTGFVGSYASLYIDYLTVKYDPDGNVVWVARYERNLPEEVHQAWHYPRLAVGGNDDVYLAGSINAYDGPTSHDLLLVKYTDPPVFDPVAGRYEPTTAWARTFDDGGHMEQSSAIAVNAGGDVYVAGRSWDLLTNTQSLMVLKYEEASTDPVWVAYHSGAPPRTQPYDLQLDSTGFVLMTGIVGSDAVTLELDPVSGNEVWVSTFDGGGTDATWQLAVDDQDHVLVGAVSENLSTGYYDNVVVKYSPAGGELWSTAVYGTDYFDPDDHPYIAVDGAGNVYLQSSHYHELEGDWDFQVTKLDDDGSIVWTDVFENVNGDWDASAGVALDPSGNLVATAWVGSGPPQWSYSVQVLKYDNTQPGNDVDVAPAKGASLTFAEITTPGETTVEFTSTAPPLPSGFQIPGGEPAYFEISTSATFTGVVTLAFAYDESLFADEESIRILHFDDAMQDWVDVTTSVDTDANVVYGETTSFSPFVLVEALDIVPPTADAGQDQSIRAGDNVLLDGGDSFDNNTESQALTYAWSFSSLPAGSTAVLTGADTATPSFVADVAASYEVALVVTDEAGLASPPDSAIVSTDNLAPTAVAGQDRLVVVHDPVLVDGTGSTDPESDALGYAWTITAAPAGSTASIDGADMAQASFTPDVEGLYELTLVVSDFIGAGTPDSLAVTATNAATFAEHQILQASQLVANAAAWQVTNHGNRQALVNHMSQAMLAIQQGDTGAAVDKLEKSIARTDGCSLHGAPDGNGPGRDWVTDCSLQGELLSLLSQALQAML